MKGDSLGIVIGGDGSAASPLDNQMKQKFHHGVRGAQAVAISQMANLTGDTNSVACFSTSWSGIQFIVQQPFRLTNVQFKLYRTGAPGNATVTLAGTHQLGDSDGNPKPEVSANSIATSVVDLSGLTTVSPGVMVNFPFAGIELIPGVVYTLYLKTQGATAANCANMRYQVTVPTAYTSFWGLVTTTNSGSAWSPSPSNWVIAELDGTNLVDVQHGGCEIRDIVVADPNAQFTISRLFYNSSGAPATIQECGIYAAVTRCINVASAGSSTWTDVWPVCIARDVVSPAIVLASGQVLQISYIPAITV
jgi:hypothetical protein